MSDTNNTSHLNILYTVILILFLSYAFNAFYNHQSRIACPETIDKGLKFIQKNNHLLNDNSKKLNQGIEQIIPNLVLICCLHYCQIQILIVLPNQVAA